MAKLSINHDALNRHVHGHPGSVFLAAGLGVLVIFLPLPLGGVLEIARVILAGTMVVLFLVFWAFTSRSDKVYSLRARLWILPWLILSVFIAMHIALPVRWLPSGWHVYSQAVIEQLGPDLRLSPSAIASVTYWATFSLYWVAAWVVSTLSRKGVRVLLWLIFSATVFQALLGLTFLVQKQDLIPWLLFFGGEGSVWDSFGKAKFIPHARGSFYLYNHYAGFLSMSGLIVLAGIFSSRRTGGFTRRKGLQIVLGVLFAMIIGMALLASRSRLGVLSGVVGGVLFAVLILRRARGLESRWVAYAPWIALGVALLAGLWFGIDRLIERYLQLPDHTDRFQIWAALFDLPLGVWVVGTGASSFLEVFKLVHPSGLAPSYWRAHNDWLQFVLEFGLLASLVVGLTMVWWFRRAACHASGYSMLQLGALSALVVQSVHSLGDFDLQIPGAALVFWVALGLVANPHIAGRAHREKSFDQSP